MSENSNSNENSLSHSHIEESNKTTNSITEKDDKRKSKQICKKCKKSYIDKGNKKSKRNSNIQIPDSIYKDGFNQDSDKNEEIQNLLKKRGSFDINECATNISVWPDSQTKNTCENIIKKRELSTLKDNNIKEVNIENSRIKLYDMSYYILNESESPKNENTPIENFWKQYNGIDGNSSSIVNDKSIKKGFENYNSKSDEKMGTRFEDKGDTNILVISNKTETTFNTSKDSISESNVNISSKPAINELITVSDTEKKTTEDLKILEVNSKNKTGKGYISLHDTLEGERIPLDETTLHISSKDGNFENVEEVNVVKKSIQNINIVETSRYIKEPFTLEMESESSVSKRDQSIKDLIQQKTVSKSKSDKTNQYELGVGQGEVELLICDYTREPRICINPKFICDDINPNIIFNHSCFSIIPSSCDSILEYTTPNDSVKEVTEKFSEKVNNSINKTYKDSEITKSFKENENTLIEEEKTDAFQVNPYEEYTNNGKEVFSRDEKRETLSEKKSKEKLILNETECFMNSLNLGILNSKNDVQDLKKENLKRIYESKNSQVSILSNMYSSKDRIDSSNQTRNKSFEELKDNDINLSNQHVNLYEESYIDVKSSSGLETKGSFNNEKTVSRSEIPNSEIKLSKEKILLTETKTNKSVSELTENNININLDEVNTNQEQETLPVRFGINLPDSNISKPLETVQNKYEKMSKSLLTISEKLEEIEENIKKATAPVEQITIYDTTNKIIKKSKQDLNELKESCKKMDKLIDLISNESIIYGSYNVPEKKSRFDKNNIIINEDIPPIDNHINVNQKIKSKEVINKDLFMSRNNKESNNTKEDIDEQSTKDYKTFENLVKELTLPLLENDDNESKIYKPEIPSRRIIIEEDVSSNKEKNILENQEIHLNKEIAEVNKKKERTIVDNLDELNRLIGNNIHTTEKDTLKVPSMFLGPKNASKPPQKNTMFLLVGPNELIKPVTNNNLIRRPRTSMIDNGLKNLEVIDKKNIKPNKISNIPEEVLFEKKVLIPEVKIKKKESKDKNGGAFTKLSKSFTSLFSSDKKPSKAKKVVKSSSKGEKWTDHESYLELQKQKGKVKDMIEYYNNLDDKDSDTEL